MREIKIMASRKKDLLEINSDSDNIDGSLTGQRGATDRTDKPTDKPDMRDRKVYRERE